jgi:glycolate oxidase
MKYNNINTALLQQFKTIVGEVNVYSDAETLLQNSSDETEDLVFLPEVVLKPRTANEVGAVMKLCNAHLIPVTPRGAGTGLSGGALPVYGGLVLNMSRFNEIIFIDENNLQVTVEPGVITEVLQNAVKEKGLFYPPDPASKGSCFIGGNVSENSGGPKAVKYGVVKDYVLNLEIVLPNGEIIWTGANVLKNATGFNLTQLLVGSEGLLGIITKIVLRLIPYPQKNMLLLAPFQSAEKACEAVAKIFQAGIVPSGLEFMERDAIDWALQFVNGIVIKVEDTVKAHLLIEVDGQHENELMMDIERISEILTLLGCEEILFAETSAEKDNLWRLRRGVAEAVKSHSIYKEEDTVVPRAELPKLLVGVKSIGQKYGFKSVCYGHAGDGNLHVNIIKDDLSDTFWEQELPKAIRELFELVASLGGTISGEHGIGLVQKDYLDIVFNQTQLQLMKSIKSVFDPNGILNPGKVF